ncbi:DUF2267 domain-containing protein [Nonomuraea sp. NPDC002799]
MEFQDFISIVKQAAGLANEEAERVSCLTLRLLARRISAGAAADLGELLPEPLQTCLEPEGPPEKYHHDEFIGRIAEIIGTGPDAAERQARGVLAALGRAVGPEEFANLRSELPDDFALLLDAASGTAPPEAREPSFTGNLPYDTFVGRVATRAGIGRERAARAAEAVLEVLGIRLSGGQVAEISPPLPAELRAALLRGNTRGRQGAVPASPDVFLHDVAKREDVTRADAYQDVKAVFAVLREAIGEKEYHDMIAELPGGYRPLLRQG